MPAESAETVAVDLIARGNGDFDVKMKQSASNFGKSMKDIETSGAHAEAFIAGRLRAMEAAAKRLNVPFDAAAARVKILAGETKGATERLKELSDLADKAANDVGDAGTEMVKTGRGSRGLAQSITTMGRQLAAGQSPFEVLVNQSSRAGAAIDSVTGSSNKFISFIGGPWGAALFAAISILGSFILKKREAAEKTDKAERAQRSFIEVLRDVKSSYEEVTKALAEYNREQEKGREITLQVLEDQARAIAGNLREAVSIREKIKAQIESTKQNVESSRVRAIVIGNLEDQLASQEKIIAELQQGARNTSIEIADAISEIASDPAQKLKTGFEIMRNEARATITDINELTKRLTDLNRQEKAALDSLSQRQRQNRSTASLPPVTGQEIAAVLGTTITSGHRSAARNRAVGGSATSHHLGGPNAAVQAIDIPLTVNGKPLTKSSIRAMLEPLGVEIKELLGPGDPKHDDHFHIAFAKRRLGSDKIAEQAQRSADQDERRRQAFDNELASLQNSQLDAVMSLVQSAEELARIELASIEIARQKYNDNLESLVAQRKLTADEAEALQAINDERAALRSELVRRREDERRFRMAEAEIGRNARFASEERANLADILNGQADLVRTQTERRSLERRLIELQFAEEKARNDYLIGYYERLKVQEGITESELAEAAAAAKIAELRNASLGQRQGQAEQRSDRSTAGPLESLFGDIPQTADQINEALESVAAGGLTTFTDALTDAIVNFRSLGDVGLAVLQQLTAALIRMAIQQLILRALGPLLGFSGGGEVAGFSGGGQPVRGYAPGGLITGPGTSTSDSVPAITSKGPIRVSDGEYIIRGESVRKLGVPLLNQINASGTIPRGFASGGPTISNSPASPSGSNAAFASIRPEDMRRLAQIVGEAAMAMPDVKLYPTADPVAAFRSALASPGGQRAFFEFFSANSGKAQASLTQ